MRAKFGDFVVSALVVAMPLGVALAGTYLPGEGDFDVSVWRNIGSSDYATGIYNYNEPRPKLYLKCNGQYKHLPLPYETWSVTTVVFKKKS